MRLCHIAVVSTYWREWWSDRCYGGLNTSSRRDSNTAGVMKTHRDHTEFDEVMSVNDIYNRGLITTG